MSARRIILYGATGYTGRAIVDHARRLGLDLVLAGRSPAALAELSRASGYVCRIARLDDRAALRKLMTCGRVCLNAAGPFSQTAQPLIAACLDRGVSYLDLSGEVDSIARAAALDSAARRARSMVLPAVGFDVVPSDCLASVLSERVPDAVALAVAVCGLDHFSRGSARAMVELVGRPIRARRAGELVPVPAQDTLRVVEFGRGRRKVRAADWADLVTAYYTTGISNVTTYIDDRASLRWSMLTRHPSALLLAAPAVQTWLQTAVAALPAEPDPLLTARARSAVVACVEDARGHRTALAYETGDVYRFSAEAACLIARRAAAGDIEYGFQTPARVYGHELLSDLTGRRIESVAWS